MFDLRDMFGLRANYSTCIDTTFGYSDVNILRQLFSSYGFSQKKKKKKCRKKRELLFTKLPSTAVNVLKSQKKQRLKIFIDLLQVNDF